MPLPISSEDPILIVVDQEGGWNAYSLQSEPTERDIFLMGLLMDMGGINESVTPGTWQFNAVVLDPKNTIVSLEPSPGDQSRSRIFHGV